jgi:endogenous inhibitor of DNA gyrase (YacG/DUF329 family)
MIQSRCPTCSKSFTIDSLDDLPSFPFCSDRCKLIDLGRWIDGVYAIPGPMVGNTSNSGRDKAENLVDNDTETSL